LAHSTPPVEWFRQPSQCPEGAGTFVPLAAAVGWIRWKAADERRKTPCPAESLPDRANLQGQDSPGSRWLREWQSNIGAPHTFPGGRQTAHRRELGRQVA